MEVFAVLQESLPTHHISKGIVKQFRARRAPAAQLRITVADDFENGDVFGAAKVQQFWHLVLLAQELPVPSSTFPIRHRWTSKRKGKNDG